MNVVNFQDGQCKRIRAYLDSYLNNELLVETNHEVLKHIERCNGCAGLLEARARVKEALQRAVRDDVAPPELRARIQKQIRRTTPATRTWLVAAAAAVALLVGGLGALKVWRAGGHPELPAAPGVASVFNEQNASVLKIGIGDHVHCAIDSGMSRLRFTEEEMAIKMGPDYRGLVPLVRARLSSEFEVAVAHRCTFNGREFVHLILKKDARVLSVVITRKSGESFSKDDFAADIGATGVPIHESRMSELGVAGFETRDYLAFVVSDLAAEQNRLIASSLAPAVRDFLAKLDA